MEEERSSEGGRGRKREEENEKEEEKIKNQNGVTSTAGPTALVSPGKMSRRVSADMTAFS